MAGRKPTIHPIKQAQVREKIRATCLINRLENYALAEQDANGDIPHTMTPAQVTAALGLLKKVIPDITEATLQGVNGGPIQFARVELVCVSPQD